MNIHNLEWRTIADSRSPHFFRKHTRLAVAFYLSHRFAIYEMRGPANSDGSFDDYYIVTDAHSVNDEDLRSGVLPKIVYRTSTLDIAQAVEFCDNAA